MKLKLMPLVTTAVEMWYVPVLQPLMVQELLLLLKLAEQCVAESVTVVVG